MPLMRLRSTPEVLNTTTLRARRMRFSLVWGLEKEDGSLQEVDMTTEEMREKAIQRLMKRFH